MHREQNPNIQILEIAVESLGPLADEMVFLGGLRHRVVIDRHCCTADPGDKRC